MAKPALLIMAAGMGSRYGGIKQIDPIGPNGEIIIDYSIYDAIRAGFGKVVFIIRKDIEEVFRECVGKTIEKRIDTHYVFQELSKIPAGFTVPASRTKPWGTGHAILMAQPVIQEPFAVINADDFYGASSFKVLADYLKNAKDSGGFSDTCLIGYILRNTLSDHGFVSRGICSSGTDGCLLSIVERTKIQKMDGAVKFEEGENKWTEVSPETLVSMNMWGFTPSLFAELESRFPRFLSGNLDKPKAEFFIPEIVGQLVQEKKTKVRVLSTNEKWFGVTYKEDKPIVEEAIRALVKKGLYPDRLWS